MSRYQIIYTDKGPAVLRNVRKHASGEPLLLLDQDEAATITLDLTALLETGETISSATKVDQQDVTATVTAASPLVTVALSAANDYFEGYTTIKITLSSGEIIRQRIHCRRTNRWTQEEDRRSDYQ